MDKTDIDLANLSLEELFKLNNDILDGTITVLSPAGNDILYKYIVNRVKQVTDLEDILNERFT